MNQSQAIEQLASAVSTNINSLIKVYDILKRQTQEIGKLNREIRELKSKIK
jgi:hypothetical protein